MSRRRPSAQPTAQLSHPNDPTIKITVRKPTRFEAMQYGDQLNRHYRATIIYDKDDKPVVDKASGQPMSYLQARIPAEMFLEALKLSVVGWEGVVDESGASVPFKKENLAVLFEEWLDAEIEVEIEGAMVKQQIPLHRWLSEQIAKPETFDSDPKANGSASQ